MAAYLVTYDLVNNAPESDYEDLIDELKRVRAHAAQKSVWLVSSSENAAVLYRRFKAHMHEDDRLMVIELADLGSWTSRGFRGTKEWLSSHVGPADA